MNPINEIFTIEFKAMLAVPLAALAALASVAAVSAQNSAAATSASSANAGQSAAERATYADLVTMAERSDLVLRAQIRDQAVVKPERAPGLAPGHARLYIEAETLALIGGTSSIGESLAYLVDVPLDAKGKAPKLKDRQVLLFADSAGRGAKGAAQLQLTGKYGQFAYSPAFEARVRAVLSGLASAQRPPIITGIADALAVPGTLAGESETQVFLRTQDRSPVSMTVLRRPGQPPVWGVSWGEIIDSSANAPQPETLRWYRLACALPNELPSSANLARDPDARRLAASDYAFIVEQLGPCERALT